MHPAYSVIIFTCASGAGYGLLAWLGLGLASGLLPPSRSLGLLGLGLATALISGGLLSSTLHLGRPTRAWRAFSQWRTSWLSREGVLAVATFVPLSVLSVLWIFYESDGLLARSAGLIAAALSLATVWATGMIYASLPTIPAWARPLTAPNYVVLGLATGGIVTLALLRLLNVPSRTSALLCLAVLGLAYALKAAYWSDVDGLKPRSNVASATGLASSFADSPRPDKISIRVVEQPHSQANYVMREMGYTIARKHASTLRRLVVVLLFLAPLGLLAAQMIAGPLLGVLLAGVMVASATLGVFVERWLFFAEARHVSMLYYGAEKV